MACVKPDCSYMHNESSASLPPPLLPNPDISGIGVLIGFVGIAYVTLLLLILQYLIIKPSDTNLNGSTNPVDQRLLAFFWGTLKFLWAVPRKWAPLMKLVPPLKKPSARFGEPLKQAILVMSDAQLVTGLAILIGGCSQINCGISIFHWHMVVRLAWFSSVTHLTTLTFLRRYIHDNRGIRILRLVLMLALMLMLAVALVPTGGNCGMRTWAHPPPYYPGSPAKCCFLRMSSFGKKHFSDEVDPIGANKNNIVTMVISEVLLICSSLTRVIKLFRRSSEFSRTWLRYKPARMCRHVAKMLEQRYYNSHLKSTRGMYIAGHCAIMAFIAFARAIYDFADSVLFEILWLLFALSWGTIRIFKDRNAADRDNAAKPDSERDFVLQENSWGFGQLIPTLLLILPLFGLIEGIVDTLKSKPTDLIEDDTAATLDEAPLSNKSSKKELPDGPLPSIGPFAELDIATNIDTINLERTGTFLVNMENDLGSNYEKSHSTVTGRDPALSSEHPLQPKAELQLQSSIHQWPFKTFYKYVYGFGVISVAFLFLFFGATFLLFAAYFDMAMILYNFSRGVYPITYITPTL